MEIRDWGLGGVPDGGCAPPLANARELVPIPLGIGMGDAGLMPARSRKTMRINSIRPQSRAGRLETRFDAATPTPRPAFVARDQKERMAAERALI